MPKMKTNRGAAKRFKLKKSGKIKRGTAFRSHILTKQDPKTKRRLRSPKHVDKANVKQVRELLGK
ncbi:MAG: 50S ribosomal protein L35 [Nautilia sp.]|nr:MAG: 50S ribosomal protein L35 [Nautilia sp.]